MKRFYTSAKGLVVIDYISSVSEDERLSDVHSDDTNELFVCRRQI